MFYQSSDEMSEITDTASRLSLRSLQRSSEKTAKARYNAEEDAESNEEDEHIPRPRRAAVTRNKVDHRNYIPEGAIIPMLDILNPFLEKMTKGKELSILEPFCGTGQISRVLRSRGYKVVEQDPYSDFVSIKTDYLATNDPVDCAFTFSFPPDFNIFLILRKAFEKRKPFAFFIHHSYLTTPEGAELFEKYPLTVFAFRRGVKFVKPDRTTSVITGMAWFVGNLGNRHEYIEFRYLDKALVTDEETFSIVGQDIDEL